MRRNPSMDAEPAKHILRQVADEEGLPRPLREVGSGSEGIVFETADPAVVCRVGTTPRVLELLEWQHTNAVVRVLYTEKMEATDLDGSATKVVVSWQEAVDTDVEGYFHQKYKNDDRTWTAILGSLDGLCDSHWKRDKIKILREYDETADLAEAVKMGMPTSDLNLGNNLGITADGRVVAYDL